MAEDDITAQVTIGVINGFEMIDIDHQNRKFCLGLFHLVCQLKKRTAVEQAGQRIPFGSFGNFVFLLVVEWNKN